jgi:type IV secretion system protein TrbI
MAENSENPDTPGTSSVTDRRPTPRGVLPRGMQTWLMTSVAVVMLLVILLTGRREPSSPARPAATPPQAPSSDRVRDYQERLRAVEAQAALQSQTPIPTPTPSAPVANEPLTPRPEDPIVAERRRREYESLFASNVVVSRRPESERPDAGRPATPTATPTASALREPANPSIDDIADAAVRATSRLGAATTNPSPIPTSPPSQSVAGTETAAQSNRRSVPTRTGPITDAGPMHRVLEGTILDTVLTNRLDGGTAAPVNCLVTNPLYSHSGQYVLIPAGSRVLGETKPVQALGETRLAVAFHRLLLPDGRTYSLDQSLGLNQIGDTGLRDQVNQHYWSTFGAAGAVGLISGLTQYLGTAGFSGCTGDRTVIFGGGSADAAAQASLQVMNRFLNRLPTITIREGHRVKVYLTSDLELPAYDAPSSLAGKS